MRNDLTQEQLNQPVNITLPLSVIIGLGESRLAPSLRTTVSQEVGLIGARYQGGILAGMTLDLERPARLILLPEEFNGAWKDAAAWAEKQGGVLPSRIDQLVLFKNLKGEFKDAYYWSGEEYAPDPGYAWLQVFSDGSQDYYHKDYDCRGRAVRREVL